MSLTRAGASPPKKPMAGHRPQGAKESLVILCTAGKIGQTASKLLATLPGTGGCRNRECRCKQAMKFLENRVNGTIRPPDLQP